MVRRPRSHPMPRSLAFVLRFVVALALVAAAAPAQGHPTHLPPAWAQAFAVQSGTLQSLALPATPVGQVAVPVVMGGVPVLIELAPFDVRSPGFQLWTRNGGQLAEVVPPPAAATWRGAIAGEVGSAVAATIADGGLKAYVRRGNGEVWVVQPLRDVMPAAAATTHAVSSQKALSLRLRCRATAPVRVPCTFFRLGGVVEAA